MFGLMVLACVLGSVQQLRADQGPFQSWLTVSYSQRLDYSLEFMMEGESRFQGEDPEWNRLELMPQLIWHYSPRYDFGIGYENNRTEFMDDMESVGNEGFLFVTVKLPVREWTFSSRQRFQAGVEEMEDMEETTAMFRHLVRVQYDNGHMPLKLVPYLENEWFFNLMDGYLSQNRVRAGLGYPVNSHVMVDVYGMRLDEWKEMEGMPDPHVWLPVFGVSLNLEF